MFFSWLNERSAERRNRLVLRALAVLLSLVLAGVFGLAALEELGVMALLVVLIWSGSLLACATLLPSSPGVETALHRSLLAFLWLDLVLKGFLRAHFGLRPNHSLVIE